MLDARAITFFLLIFQHLPLFLRIYLHLFQKTPSLDGPGWMPGAVAPTRTPLCTPLLRPNV